MRQRDKYLILGAGALATGVLLLRKSAKHPPLPTVSSVDLTRYAGKWYEIAAFPKWFEKGCHCTTAEYTLDKGYVAILNSCLKGGKNGLLDVAKGKGFPVPGSQNTRLKVQFFWPFRGDYWILDLAEDYSYALVGAPDRKSLWILSRTPQLSAVVYQKLVIKARNLGFDVRKLKLTRQECSAR